MFSDVGACTLAMMTMWRIDPRVVDKEVNDSRKCRAVSSTIYGVNAMTEREKGEASRSWGPEVFKQGKCRPK